MTPILNSKDEKNKTRLIPLIPLRNGIVFPDTEGVLTFGRSKSTQAVEDAYESEDQLIGFVTQKDAAVDDPRLKEVYQVGTICKIERILDTEGEINALVKGVQRIRVKAIKEQEPYWVAEVEELDEETEESEEVEVLVKHLTKQLKKAVKLGKSVDFLIFMRLVSGVEPSELADQVAMLLDIKPEAKQDLLETLNVKQRLKKVAEFFSQELKVLEIDQSINAKTQKRFNQSMRKTVLKERLKTIQKELGEDDEDDEISNLRKKISDADMPEEVEEKAKKELNRLSKMHTYNPEAGYLRSYLETVVEIPWKKRSENNITLKEAEEVLKKDHYGLDEVKERILEHLAVMKLKQKKNKTEQEQDQDQDQDKEKKTKVHPGTTGQGTILCFVGPPGVGKTSMGRSIANALGRRFVKVSLGGIRDEAEIRGHRRTYVGAMPGRIIRGIQEAGTKNPVFMMDEIDKVGKDFRGDPSAALLEVLDPEQNSEFMDHYLDVPFDLSDVLFITTANVLNTIPPALKDRLEVIRFSGYTEDEKFKIAKKFLMEKVLQANALSEDQITISKPVLHKIIEKYTREAGVRELERKMSKIARKVARKIAEEGREKEVRITSRNLQKYLGAEKHRKRLAKEKNELGVATGLAWTQAGGEILFIECALMPGKGEVTLTGQLGDVMKESCKAGLSYARSQWKELGISKEEPKKKDVHVHVPEGAVPKDGPSAGVAIATAIISSLTEKKINKEIGMTGEITLRGKVLEIGGVKEKVIAAHRAGLKKIILPAENEKNLEKVPEDVKKDIEFIFVETLKEVLDIVLVG